MAVVMLWSLAILPVAAIAQTRVDIPKNKYKVQDDVKIGGQAANEVEQKFPILNDSAAQSYISRVGERLVSAIPQQYRHPEFDYSFKIVNASDINAFALPGGPMFVNRGMIEAAKNEGEMAGVMAHEISHVALRHATAQQTKQGSWQNQLGVIGLVLGGAILGGQTGAQLGMLGAQAWMTKYSRDYETQADILGSHIMANAGYDPTDLANMFKTIQAQGGASGPEWLSSHPDPGNRYEKITREASFLDVSPEPIKVTRDFSRIKERLSSMPPARTMAQIEKSSSGGGNSEANTAMANGRYSTRVATPSTRTQRYSTQSIQFNYPSNWRVFADNSLTLAPEGAYGSDGITHGIMIGAFEPQSNNLLNETKQYVDGLLQANDYLRRSGNYTRTTVAGQSGYTTTLVGRSPITRRDERVTIYTAQTRGGAILAIAAVSPNAERTRYSTAFRNIISSVRVNN